MHPFCQPFGSCSKQSISNAPPICRLRQGKASASAMIRLNSNIIFKPHRSLLSTAPSPPGICKFFPPYEPMMTSKAPSLCCTLNATTNNNRHANISLQCPSSTLSSPSTPSPSIIPPSPIYTTKSLDFRHAYISFLYRLRRKGGSQVYALHISYSCKHLPSPRFISLPIPRLPHSPSPHSPLNNAP
jgi:hypothetical protein